jgi:tetratricopeptide (TPR) repeat protein
MRWKAAAAALWGLTGEELAEIRGSLEKFRGWTLPTERQVEDLLKLFTDRDDAIQAVVTRLDYDAYPPGSVLPLIVFHGIGGVGKTWLLRYLIEKHLKPHQLPYALVDLRGGRFNAADALFAELADQLAAFGFQFPRFGLVFASYRFRTVGQDVAGPQLLLDHLGPISKVVRATPVIKDFAQLFDALEEAASDAASWFQTHLGETWRAQLQPRNAERLVALMPQTFAADIAQELWGPNVKAGAVRRPVLILDTYEDLQRAGDDFVRELAAHLQDSLLIVAGWNRLPWPDIDPTWADPARLVQHLLGHFSLADSDYYLRERRHVADEGLRRRIYDFTQGHPMCLALAGDLVRLQEERAEPVNQATFPRREFDEKLTTQWLTKRILERLPEQVEKDLRAASVPRRFNAEILGVLLDDPTGAERRLRALTAYSFVGVDEASGDFTLHGLVRQMLLAQLRRGRQERPYRELNRKLADYYAPQAQEDFAAFVEQMYHRWAFEPEVALSTFGDRFYQHVRRFELGECERLLAAAREQADRYQAGLPDVLAREAQLRYQQARWDEALQILEPLWQAHEQLSDGLTSMLAGTLGLVYEKKGEWERAIEFYQKDLAIAEKLGYLHGLAQTYGNLGEVYRMNGEWARAIEFYQKGLDIFEKLGDLHDLATTYMNLGLVYAAKGEWERAIEFYQKALDIFEKLGDLHRLAQTYNNLGEVYRMKGEWARASEFHQQSLAIKEKLGDVHGLAATYTDLGLVYARKGEWQRAIELYQQSLAIFGKLGDVYGLARTYGNLGSVYLRKGEWERAIEFYQQSLAILEKLGDVHGLAATYGNLGYLYEARGDFPSALAYASRALDIFHRLGAFEEKQVAELVARLKERLAASNQR